MKNHQETKLDLKNLSRDEALCIVKSIDEKVCHGQKVSAEEIYFMNQILYAVQKRFLEEIRDRQTRIPDLKTDEFGYEAFWGGELTPGCRNCIDRGFQAIRSVSTCNLNCSFCYYFGEETEHISSEHYSIHEGTVTGRDLKMMIRKAMTGPQKVSGIAWVWFEPFMEFDKHPDLIRYIHDQGIYQHLYTNGTLCNRENLKALADAGLKEIRFNLAATNCSKKVLENMRIAREYFQYVCIESPMFKEYFDTFIGKSKEILATGVDHIHCAELHLQKHNLKNYFGEELYEYSGGYVSPMSSRRLTYDLMDIAVEEGWEDVVIHDCSNEIKFLRGVSDKVFGRTEYRQEVGLPISWFVKAIDNYDFICRP